MFLSQAARLKCEEDWADLLLDSNMNQQEYSQDIFENTQTNQNESQQQNYLSHQNEYKQYKWESQFKKEEFGDEPQSERFEENIVVFPNFFSEVVDEQNHQCYANFQVTADKINFIITEDIQESEIQFKYEDMMANKGVSAVQWNKKQKFIEISYFTKEQFEIERHLKVKIDQEEDDDYLKEESISLVEGKSQKSTKSEEIHSSLPTESIIERRESSQISQNLSIQIEDIHFISQRESQKEEIMSSYFDSSAFNAIISKQNCENQQVFIRSDYFSIQPSADSIPQLESTILNQDFSEFSTNSNSNLLNSNQITPLMTSIFSQESIITNEKKVAQIFNHIFTGTSEFSKGEIVCTKNLILKTADNYDYAAQCLWQVFPLRNVKNQINGCIIKQVILVFDSSIREIQQKRAKIRENATIEIPQLLSNSSQHLKLETMFTISEEKQLINQSFSQQVYKFLYKFKYIKKNKCLKSKKDQDLFPSKTCKYRLIK